MMPAILNSGTIARQEIALKWKSYTTFIVAAVHYSTQDAYIICHMEHGPLKYVMGRRIICDCLCNNRLVHRTI